MTVSPERKAWADRARAKDIFSAAQALGIPVKRSNAGMPCPLCGGTDRFSVSKRKQISHCRQCGTRDVIKLVEDVKGYDFNQACEWLTGEAPPGAEASPVVAATRDAKPALAEAKSAAEIEAEDNAYRSKEIGKARGIWDAGIPIEGTPVEAYLAGRGLHLAPPAQRKGETA